MGYVPGTTPSAPRGARPGAGRATTPGTKPVPAMHAAPRRRPLGPGTLRAHDLGHETSRVSWSEPRGFEAASAERPSMRFARFEFVAPTAPARATMLLHPPAKARP